MDQPLPSHDPGIKNIEDVCTAWAQKEYGSEYTVKSVKDKHLKVLSEGNINYGESEESSPVEIKRSDMPSLKNWSGSPKTREFSVQSTKKYTCGFTKTKGTQFSGDLSVNVGLPAHVGLKATMGGQIQLSRTTSETSQRDDTSTTVEKFEQRPWSILLVQKVTTQKVITQPYTLGFRLKGKLKITLQKTNGKTKTESVNVVDLYRDYPDGKIETDAKGKKSVLLTEEGTCETKEVYEVMERKEPDAEKLMQIIQEDLLDDNKKKIAEEVSDLPTLLDVMFSVSQKSPVKEGVDGLVDMLKNTEPETFLVFVDILKEDYPEYKELVGLLDPRPMYHLADGVRHISNLSGVVDHRHKVTKKERDVKDSLESARGVILHGMPGSGKTQLAYKVAGDYARVHPHSVVWVIDGSSEEKLNEGMANLQQRLGGETNVDNSMFQSLISRWKHFLLLIDDLSPQVAIPTPVLSSSAKMIVTTQDSLIREFEDVANIPIEGFKEDEAVEFLRDERYPKMYPPKQMKDLASIFSRLPLGLAAARASIHRGNMTVKEYKRQLKGGRKALKALMDREDNWLQKHYKDEHHEAARNIFAALQVAINKLDDSCKPGEEKKCKVMLQPCAFLEPNNIPVLILKSALESSPTIGADAHFAERMRMYSLGSIEGAGVKRRLSIHGVTQMALRLHMDEEQQTTCIKKLLQILVKFFVKDMTYSEIHKFSLELMPHVKEVLKHADKLKLGAEYPLMKARLLMVYGHLLIQKGTPRLSREDLQKAKESLLQFADNTDYRKTSKTKDLYQSLARKSQSLEDGLFKETVIKRAITRQTLRAVSDELGAEHSTTRKLKEMVENFEPLTTEMYKTLVRSNLAIPVKKLKRIFLPELYISIMFTLVLSKDLAYYDHMRGSRITLAIDMCTEVTKDTGVLVMVRFLADFLSQSRVKGTDMVHVISCPPYIKYVEPIVLKAVELLIFHETKGKTATRSYDFGLLTGDGDTLLKLNYYENVMVCCIQAVQEEEREKKPRLFSWGQDTCKKMLELVESESQAGNPPLRLPEYYMTAGLFSAVVVELEKAAEMFWKAYRVELKREEYHPRLAEALSGLIQVRIKQSKLRSARVCARRFLQLAKDHWPDKVKVAEEIHRNVYDRMVFQDISKKKQEKRRAWMETPMTTSVTCAPILFCNT